MLKRSSRSRSFTLGPRNHAWTIQVSESSTRQRHRGGRFPLSEGGPTRAEWPMTRPLWRSPALLPLAGGARGCTGKMTSKNLGKSMNSNRKSYPVQKPDPAAPTIPLLELTLEKNTGQRSITTSTAAPTTVARSKVSSVKYMLPIATRRHCHFTYMLPSTTRRHRNQIL